MTSRLPKEKARSVKAWMVRAVPNLFILSTDKKTISTQAQLFQSKPVEILITELKPKKRGRGKAK